MTSKLTKKEKGFVKDYLDTGIGGLAIKNNFDVADMNTAYSMSSEYLRKPKIQKAIENHAEDAESMIYKLSQKAKAEIVRLNASKDIMDRAGFKPTDKTESKTTHLNIEIDKDTLELAMKYELALKAKL